MIELGKRVRGRAVYIPRAILRESVPGAVYLIEVRTRRAVPERWVNPDAEVAELLKRKLEEKGIEVLWVRVDETIYIQARGSPFSWSLILALLPEILGAIGIIVTLIAVFLVIAEIPGWVLALLLAGLSMAYIGPKLGEMIKR